MNLDISNFLLKNLKELDKEYYNYLCLEVLQPEESIIKTFIQMEPPANNIIRELLYRSIHANLPKENIAFIFGLMFLPNITE